MHSGLSSGATSTWGLITPFWRWCRTAGTASGSCLCTVGGSSDEPRRRDAGLTAISHSVALLVACKNAQTFSKSCRETQVKLFLDEGIKLADVASLALSKL